MNTREASLTGWIVTFVMMAVLIGIIGFTLLSPNGISFKIKAVCQNVPGGDVCDIYVRGRD